MPSASYTFTERKAGTDYLVRDPAGPTGQAMVRLGNRVANRAKEYANVDTGNMRSRIEFRLEVDGRDLLGIVAARTDYSYWVHEGNGYYEGNPFLRNALADEIGSLA